MNVFFSFLLALVTFEVLKVLAKAAIRTYINKPKP